MATRTDIHRPSAINPEEYSFVACDYYGGGIDGMYFAAERQAFRAHMQKTGGKFAEQQNEGTCYVCGARAMYVGKFHHIPTNTYITTGMDCAAKLDMDDSVAFRSFKKRIAAGREAAAGRAKAQKILTEMGLAKAWEVFVAETSAGAGDAKYEEAKIIDLVSKLVRYGSISVGQENFIRGLLAKLEERAARDAARAEEAKSFAPVPQIDARVSFEGTVIATRVEESDFGETVKMLVQHSTGYKLWGTMPANLSAARGDVVSFVARIERSEKDDKFGFFRRPTKATIVRKAPEEPKPEA